MSKNNGGDISTHVNPVRIRIQGEGSIRTTLFNTGSEATDSIVLAPATLSKTTGRSVNILSNFEGEKIFLDIRTLEIDYWFEIDNIWAYVKESRISYPQV